MSDELILDSSEEVELDDIVEEVVPEELNRQQKVKVQGHSTVKILYCTS